MLQDFPMYAYIPAKDMSKGVAFEDYDMPGQKSAAGAITAGGAKAAWFKDSEGNIMALIQDLS